MVTFLGLKSARIVPIFTISGQGSAGTRCRGSVQCGSTTRLVFRGCRNLVYVSHEGGAAAAPSVMMTRVLNIEYST